MEARTEERVEDMEEKMGMKEEEMKTKLVAMEAKLEKKEALLRKELVSKEEIKEKEAELRKELGSKEDVGISVDLPYLNLCMFQNNVYERDSTITYDKFLTSFNTADGQQDLGTGVFTCRHAGIYSFTYSGIAILDSYEETHIFLFVNGVEVSESEWWAVTPPNIDGHMFVPGSRSLVNVRELLLLTSKSIKRLGGEYF